MDRKDRLKEIQKLWKSKERILKWDEIEWEPFEGDPMDTHRRLVAVHLKSDGFHFWTWGFREDASCFDWDWLLLHQLYAWHFLPEESDSVLLVNETAMAVCFAVPVWAKGLVLLFQHPDSVLLGMDHMNAEKEARDAASRARATATQLACSPVVGPTPTAKASALPFLSK